MSIAIKTINDRFKNFFKINKIIEENVKKATDKCLIHSTNPNEYIYSFNNTLFLIKNIGGKSSDGSIFLTIIKKQSKIYTLITKVQLFTDIIEYDILLKVTSYAIMNKNIHFPLVYNYLKCSKFDKNDLLLPDTININVNKKNHNYNSERIYSTSYYSIFAELADGDLFKYTTQNPLISSKYIYNALAQCLMAIISLHNLGIVHRDTHKGNFLYHKVKEEGCIKYNYKDLIFYIENIGYNWVIWDFGRCTTINSETIDIVYEDFEILIEDLINNNNNNYLILLDMNILNKIFDIIKNNKEDYLIIKEILNNNMLFSKEPIGKVISTIYLK